MIFAALKIKCLEVFWSVGFSRAFLWAWRNYQPTAENGEKISSATDASGRLWTLPKIGKSSAPMPFPSHCLVKTECSSLLFGLFPVLISLGVWGNERSRIEKFVLSQKVAIPAGLHLNNQTNNVFVLGYLQQHIFWKQIFEIVLYLENLILRALGKKRSNAIWPLYQVKWCCFC